MPYSPQPATCHPGRQRKTAAGLCESCYKTERYRSDPVFRATALARIGAYQSRMGWTTSAPPPPRTCGECGREYVPPRRAGAHTFCSEPCKDKAWARTRRATKAAAESERYSSAEVLARDGGQCQLCKGEIDLSLSYPHPLSPSIDHIVPLSRGGDNTLQNVQAAHLHCNVTKGNRTAI